MKALLSKFAGGPETLTVEELPSPVCGSGLVVVSVKACGVNYPDVLIIEDRYQVKPQRPFAPGIEFSGVIKTVGDGVTQLNVGDRVAGFVTSGAMVQELAVDAKRVFRIPDSMPFDVAAAFLITYGTAYHALQERAGLVPGETVLVLGASGGVGLAAVELAKALGADVIAAASSQHKLALAQRCGAARGAVYPATMGEGGQKALTQLFKEAVGANGANVIVDCVGGDYSEAALRCIAWQGRFLVVGFPAGIPRIPLNLVLLKSCQIVGVYLGGVAEIDPSGFRRAVAALFELYTAGEIKPYVSERFALADGGAAIRKLADRKSMGKLVVLMDD